MTATGLDNEIAEALRMRFMPDRSTTMQPGCGGVAPP
jgi:hypothetical protein